MFKHAIASKKEAAVMPDFDFNDMCKDIACEWLSEVCHEYPYINDPNGEVIYTQQAQERYDEILDMVRQLAFNYIIVEKQMETI